MITLNYLENILFFTSSGHFCIPIKNVTNDLETFNVNNVLNLNCTRDKNEKKNKVSKLHCHHNYKKIVDSLKGAEVNDKELEEELKKGR